MIALSTRPTTRVLVRFTRLTYTLPDATETLIVWTEPDGVDYALSFQDPEGCAEVWQFIEEVQRHMNAGGEFNHALAACISFTNTPLVVVLRGQCPDFFPTHWSRRS